MEEPYVSYRRSIADSGKETDKRKSNHCSKVKNSPSIKDALRKETKHKIEENTSPRSPTILRKKLSIAMRVGRFSNLSKDKTEKGNDSCYSPHSGSGHTKELGVSYGRNVTNAVKENDTRKSNVWAKHDLKRKMMGNASPRSPMIIRKKPSIAVSPSRFRNSSNRKREKGYSRPTEDGVSNERSIPHIAKEMDLRKSIHPSHVKKYPSTKHLWVKDKEKHTTDGNASPSSSTILRKMRSIINASRFRNSFLQKKEIGCDSCRGTSGTGSSPHGDLGMNHTRKTMYSRCSNLIRKSKDSHHQFCSCNTEVVDELAAASFEGSEGLQLKTSCSSETGQGDDGYDLCVNCKQPGSLVYCGGKDCKRGYHSSCSAPTLNDTQHGAWLCFCCLQKKMEFGVYSISQGIESILDSTDDVEGEKHYYVKFKGLAHIHNCWVRRSQLLIQNPVLLAKFDKKR